MKQRLQSSQLTKELLSPWKYIAALLLLCGSLQAQSSLRFPNNVIEATGPDGFAFCYGPQKPKHPQAGWWYIHQPYGDDDSVFVFSAGEWHVLLLGNLRGVSYIDGMIKVGSGDQYSLATLQGELLVKYANHYYHLGKIWVADAERQVILNNEGKILARYYGYDNMPEPPYRGRYMVCVPDDERADWGLDYHELSNWGMIDSLGNWAIAPQFDAPFIFRDGTADVMINGEKRKINEKGEFVE